MMEDGIIVFVKLRVSHKLEREQSQIGKIHTHFLS